MKEEDSNWTKDDIALLTKAVVKFPPGTNQRWKTIADYMGGRSQKDIIKKAKELAEKRADEVKNNRTQAQSAAQQKRPGGNKGGGAAAAAPY